MFHFCKKINYQSNLRFFAILIPENCVLITVELLQKKTFEEESLYKNRQKWSLSLV